MSTSCFYDRVVKVETTGIFFPFQFNFAASRDEVSLNLFFLLVCVFYKNSKHLSSDFQET